MYFFGLSKEEVLSQKHVVSYKETSKQNPINMVTLFGRQVYQVKSESSPKLLKKDIDLRLPADHYAYTNFHETLGSEKFYSNGSSRDTVEMRFHPGHEANNVKEVSATSWTGKRNPRIVIDLEEPPPTWVSHRETTEHAQASISYVTVRNPDTKPSFFDRISSNILMDVDQSLVEDDSDKTTSKESSLLDLKDNICQSIHHTPAFPKLGFQSVSPQFPVQTEKSVRTPTSYLETPKLLNPPISKPKPMEDLTASVTNRTVSLPLSCVTTDFGLGVIYASKNQESKTTREKPMLVTLNSSLEHTYQKDFKSLREILSRKVAWQTEAVNAISQIICGCKTDSTRRNQASGIWLALLGPDKVGKKKVAMTLSEVFFGGKVNYICVDFGAEHCSLDDKFRGKTVVDYVTGELSRKPHSVVLLENVEKAEFPDQMRLSEAVSTGKIRDLHGRVISMKNVIVVVTSGIAKDNATDHVIKPVKFPEEQVLSARSWKLQIKLGDATKFGVNKRKYELETAQRAVKVQRSYLDLNLPVNETEFSLDHEAEDRDAWFDEFIEKVDGKVTFKPVDFDELAKNIQEKIGSHFERCFGSETHLELDKEVILQILAASWSSLSSGEEEGRTIVDQWMQTVLARSFAEAKQKYGSNPMLGVKLVASSSGLASGVELPAKVDVIW